MNGVPSASVYMKVIKGEAWTITYYSYGGGEDGMNEKMRSSVMGLILGQFSSPLPEVQKEPVAYLYNGVRLPALPEWDREKYPFAVIWYTPGFLGIGSYYYLIISQTEIVTDATSSEKFTVGADAIVYSINAP